MKKAEAEAKAKERLIENDVFLPSETAYMIFTSKHFL